MRAAMIRAAGLIRLFREHSDVSQTGSGGDFIVKGDRQGKRPPTGRSFSMKVTFLLVTALKLMNLQFWRSLGFVSAEIRQETCTRHTRRKDSFKIKAHRNLPLWFSEEISV